jgi:hypothetical protein
MNCLASQSSPVLDKKLITDYMMNSELCSGVKTVSVPTFAYGAICFTASFYNEYGILIDNEKFQVDVIDILSFIYSKIIA